MLAPIAWRTPPEHYGPWESIAGLLTEGLVARGVDVTLFATLDSVTTADLDGVCPHGYAEDAELDGRVWEALHVSHALARSGEFELVHNHLDWLPLAFDAARAGADGDDHPRLLRRGHPSRLHAVALGVRRDLRLRPLRRRLTMPRPSITASTSTMLPYRASPVTSLSRSGASILTRELPMPSRSPASAGDGW